jgi:hypothetical protein
MNRKHSCVSQALTTMDNNRFQHSDAWIFLSLNNIEGGTSLEDLIAKADYINHAIPAEDEVEGAITRLSKAGLVRFGDAKFFLTDFGEELFEYIYSQKGSMLALWDKLEKHLNKSDFPLLNIEDFKLRPGELHVAYKKYHKRFWKTYNEMESKKKKRQSS